MSAQLWRLQEFAHGTFFFHFPTKEHVLLELEGREEERIAKQPRHSASKRDLASTLKEAVRLVVGRSSSSKSSSTVTC